MQIERFEIIRFHKGKPSFDFITSYESGCHAQMVAGALNALDRKHQYGRTVVLEPQWFVPRLAITSPVGPCCDKCDQPV